MLWLSITMIVAALLSAPAHAAMRCGSRLVTSGDHKIEVLSKCGHPALVETRLHHHPIRLPHHAHGLYHHRLLAAEIEEWTYNFGPRRFMRLVQFAGGRVVRIISLDYGY